MSTTIVTSYQGNPGLVGTVRVQIRNPLTGAVLVARTTSGILEPITGSGRYTYAAAGLIDLNWYDATWDENDGFYFGEIVASPTVTGTGGGGGGGTGLVLPAGGLSPVVTQSFFIKRGDNEPIIFAITELDTTGARIVQDVTGWTGKFKLRTQPDVGTVLINQDFYISDALGVVTTDGTDGLLAYNWPNTGETDRLGTFFAEFECHRSDGVKKTYPTTSDPANEYIRCVFVADLDDAGSH